MMKRWSSRARRSLLLLSEGPAALALHSRDALVRLVVPLIAEPFEKHQRQDVVFVILPGGLAAEDVRGTSQVSLKLLLR
jgi:hypothetical protein